MKRKPAKKKSATTNKGGRPSKFSQAVLDTICARMEKGEPLAAICRDPKMPADRTVRDWSGSKPEVSAAIARAREVGEEWLLAECLQIADTPLLGVETVSKVTGVETREGDMLGHRKLQIETRLKLLAKWNPKKYGERLTHAGDPEAPIAVDASVTVEPGEAYLRMLNGGH